MRVLVVDDDPLIVRLIEANAKRWGYEPVTASDGVQALALLEGDDPPRIVISDWMMPVMDGVELTRCIRELPDRPYTYVMLLTAKDQTEDLIHAFQAGADEFVNKPFRARELQMRLEAAKRLLEQMSRSDTVMRPSLVPDPGRIIGGRYRLTTLLGAGGMGTVWEAEHVALGSKVAVKFLRQEHAHVPAARARFETEARAAARLSSPHVVRVFDFSLAEEAPYLVMERLHGVSVADQVAAAGPLSPRDVARIVRDVAGALTRAHRLGVVHRDVKPENIVLAEDEVVPGCVTTKLIDFGVAKVVADGPREGSPSSGKMPVTQEGVVVGTPHFMSPEYLAGASKPDAALDLWGLAASAYVALVGQLPFDGESVWAVIRSVCTAPLPVPSRHNPDVPAGFDEWFAKACARSPTERFTDATALADALTELCEGAEAPPARGRAASPMVASQPERVTEAIVVAAPKTPVAVVARERFAARWRAVGGLVGLAVVIAAIVKLALAT